MESSIVVFVACGSMKEAQRIARMLVRTRLAACVNILGQGKSIYRWKRRIESATEILILVKSTRKKFAVLESEIRRLHSYDTPEIIAVPILTGSKPYLRWLHQCVKD